MNEMDMESRHLMSEMDMESLHLMSLCMFIYATLFSYVALFSCIHVRI
jgi:ABC-type polysaccharide transport system permease subunit